MILEAQVIPSNHSDAETQMIRKVILGKPFELNTSVFYIASKYFMEYFLKIQLLFVAIGVVSIILNLMKSYILVKSGLKRRNDVALLISTLADIITASVEITWLISMHLDAKPNTTSKFVPITDQLRSSSAWITVLLATQRYYSITNVPFYKRSFNPKLIMIYSIIFTTIFSIICSVEIYVHEKLWDVDQLKEKEFNEIADTIYSFWTIRLGLSLLSNIFGSILPTILLIVFNFRLYMHLTKNIKKQESRKNTEHELEYMAKARAQVKVHLEDQGQAENGQSEVISTAQPKVVSRLTQSKETNKALMRLITIFICAESPTIAIVIPICLYHAWTHFTSVIYDRSRSNISELYFDANLLALVLNLITCLLNFPVYFAMDRKFRDQVKSNLCLKRRSEPSNRAQ